MELWESCSCKILNTMAPLELLRFHAEFSQLLETMKCLCTAVQHVHLEQASNPQCTPWKYNTELQVGSSFKRDSFLCQFQAVFP